MMYIKKESVSTDAAQEIGRVKRDFEWDKVSKTDKEKARVAFDQLEKSFIRKQLFSEQKGICAYCMRRISDDGSSTIEHWLPISADATQALEYSNMMLSCDGGRKTGNENARRVLSCDAAKEDNTIKISPYNKDQMAKIRYNRDGYLYIYPKDSELQNDIDYVLKLNGEIDKNGKKISDTSNGLVRGRKQVYQYYERYIKNLDKRGKALEGAIRKKINEITDSEEYPEFAGVWLYFLNRKIRQAKM